MASLQVAHDQGVAQIYRIRLTGPAGWLAQRAYHLFCVPALSHKARVLTDWTLALAFRCGTARLTGLEHPADDFRDAFREDGRMPGYWPEHAGTHRTSDKTN